MKDVGSLGERTSLFGGTKDSHMTYIYIYMYIYIYIYIYTSIHSYPSKEGLNLLSQRE